MRRPCDSRERRLRDLAGLAARLSDDELAILLLVATRAWAGQARYGCLDLSGDPRDFRAEALEELADACFYLAAAILRRQSRHPRAHQAPRGGRGA